MTKTKRSGANGTIIDNRKARFDYFLEERFEAGVELLGWEVKSLRAGKAQLVDSFVMLRDGEAFLQGAHITPLTSASTHVLADPQRKRRLLLHARELEKLHIAVEQKGHTIVATALFWQNQKVKCGIAIAKGKKEYDKRNVEADRDWGREKRRLMKKQVA